MTNITPIKIVLASLSLEAKKIDQIVSALARGQLVVYPTDTIYGLGADPRQEAAVERLFEAKGRPPEMAIPLIAADIEQVQRCAGTLTPLARRLALKFWPGPLTLVIKAAPTLSRRLLADGDSVAVRVPSHSVARAIAKQLNHPLTATSANRTGERTPTEANEIILMFGSTVAVVLDAGPIEERERSSTIVDARGKVPVLVRDGSVEWNSVLRSLR